MSDSPSPSPLTTTILTLLSSLQINAHLQHHPAAFTVAEWLPHIQSGPHPNVTITKCLFLKDKKSRFYLVVAKADSPVDMKHVLKGFKTLFPAYTGIQVLRFADESALEDILSTKRGAVSPLALVMDKEKVINVVMDRALVELQGKMGELICVHPGSNDKTVYLTVEEVIRYVESCGHIVNVASLSP